MSQFPSSCRFVIIITFCLLSGSNCGAIFKGSRQSIQVQTSPSAVSLTLTPSAGNYTTPTTLNVERKNNYVLTFSKEGYEDTKFEIQKHLSGGILALDILFTGLIGVVIDAATGAWYNLKPEAITVNLARIGMGPGPENIEVAIQPSGSNGIQITSSVPDVKIRVTPAE